MNRNEFRQALYQAAEKQGAEFIELSYGENESFTVKVQNREIDEYEVSMSASLSLRLHYKGKEGFAYTEVLSDADTLVARAIDNAKVIEDKDEHPVQGKQAYREIKEIEDPLKALSEEDKINLAFQLEEAILKEEDVSRVHAAVVQSSRSYTRLDNSLGLEAERSTEGSAVMLAPILERGNEVKDAYVLRWDESCRDVEGIVREAVQKAAKRFGASPVPAGHYDILMSKEAARSLISGFWSIFSAEQSQKGLSCMTGLEDEMVASPLVTLVSDPMLETNPIPFDGEGSPTAILTVIDKGRFKSFMHNLKTARKAGRETSGHASAMGKSISPGNLYIKAGETDIDQLPLVLSEGLLIESISGLNAGLNAVSGEFSLLAEGQKIVDGKVSRAVDQITIAANIREFLQQITHVGNDLDFGGRGGIGSPSLIVEAIKVGGR